ncbi:universal stress protein [Natronomonas sp. LN261]|jgi:nucleotide-binding universal stress UspA family protein|uniref:universal stress protein n=1 Tax=Natronomonas sp. LN261 TaxID=2750669 RepID=UPI0015EFD6E6|nr:universal stress protein [Natronomonas sp. LN261]
MFDRILFATDGREGANTVFEHVLDIAEQHDASVHVLNVADTTHDSVTRIQGEVIDVLEREGEDIVDELAARATNRRVSVVTDVVQGGVPETIVAYAGEYDIDLIAMPVGGNRPLLGSTTERVIRRAAVPVLTLRPDDRVVRYPYQDVVVPTDGSDCAELALELAVDITRATGATLHVLSVVDVAGLGIAATPERQATLENEAEAIVAEATDGINEDAIESIEEAINVGTSVSGAIQAYGEDHGADLIVMGTHGRTGIAGYLLGSVTETVVRSAACPVLTVPSR